MDLNEATREVLNRHPWELSRTKCVLSNYIDKLGNSGVMRVVNRYGNIH